MTLRTRLAIAFTVILLGPVLLAGAFAYRTVSSDESAAADRARLAQATSAVRARLMAECVRLTATARTLAITAAAQHRPTAVAPAGAWASCDGDPLTATADARGIAAQAPVIGGGTAYATRPFDARFLGELASVAGAPVAVDPSGSGPLLAIGPMPALEKGAGLPVALAAVATAIVAAVAFGTWLAGLATHPLQALLSAADRAARGDLTARSHIAGPDEVGRLGVRLDGLVGAMRETQRLAVTDPLTGLGNVRQLTDALRLEVERATRFRRALGVLVLDLDYFKAVNDQYGHPAGDAVLTEFARRVRGIIREVDLAFRQGGEEFVILLPETDIAGSLTAARRIGEAVRAAPFAVGEELVGVTVSVGVAVYPRHGRTGAETLEAADTALYAAKAAGRDMFMMARRPVPVQRDAAIAKPTGVVGGVSVRTHCTQIPADG